jgi:hypothetical protein
MSNQQVTLALKTIETFPLKVEIAIPPEKPIIQGTIVADCYIKNREEIKALNEEQLTDSEYFDRIVHGVRGLGNDNGALTGDDAMVEVKDGKYSMYLLPAVVGAYFEQYGEARRKNSKTSLRR